MSQSNDFANSLDNLNRVSSGERTLELFKLNKDFTIMQEQRVTIDGIVVFLSVIDEGLQRSVHVHLHQSSM